jgi:hypothetical protein
VASCLFNNLSLCGVPVRLNWGRPKKHQSNTTDSGHLIGDDSFMLAPPGLESCGYNAYALPGLPRPVLPTVSEVPSVPSLIDAMVTAVTVADQDCNINKRQRIADNADIKAIVGENSNRESDSLIMLLGSYGDGDDTT